MWRNGTHYPPEPSLWSSHLVMILMLCVKYDELLFSHPFRSPIWITELLIEPAIMQLDYDIAVSGKVDNLYKIYSFKAG